MEPFLVYAIICIASMGGCSDFAPGKPGYFIDEKACNIFADELYNTYLRELKRRNQIVVDGKAFCLRFMGDREV